MIQDNQYYIIREFYDFKPNAKLIKEAIERGEPIILNGILQKANTLNRNGRVYPYDILRREATKYMKAVEENRALGECVPAGTEIYTKNGWFNIENVQIGDEIFTMNVEKNLLEIQEVTDTIEKNYNDQMIHIYNSDSLDMMVTKKHKIVLWDRNHKSYILTAEELYEKIKNNDSAVSHSYIKHSANWIGTEDEYFTLPNTDIKIKSEDWAAFLGIYIAEGHCSGTKGGKKNHIVGITQTKEESKQKIKELLDKLPFEYELKQNRQFLINNKDLHTHLFDLGYSHTKKIPAYAKDWSVNLLNILLEWMLIGDGKNRKDKYGKLLREYTTTSPQLSDDVFEIMLKIGNGATTSIIIPKDRIIEDRKILAENSKPLYIVHERTTNGIYLDCRFIHADLVDFDENVYCVTIPNSTWLMRYNEKISWTHNCDHPDCQTSDSQILTEEGWKYLPEIKEDEKIFTLNLESNQVEIQTIEKKIDAPYSGKMFHLEGKGIDIITTPNHRFLTKNKNGDLNYYTAEELTTINKKELKLLRNINWNGKEYEHIKISGLNRNFFSKKIKKDLIKKYENDLYINSEYFFKFLGFYLSEGNVFGTKGGKGRSGYLIQITQKKADTVKIIREILKNLSPELMWREVIQKSGTVRFLINDARLYNYLFKLGNSSEKYVPFEIKQASSRLLSLFIESFILGDGKTTRKHYYKKDDETRQTIFSVSKQLIEDLQEILLKTGYSANITTYKPKDRYINDIKFIDEEADNGDGTVSIIKKQLIEKRLISAKNSKLQYFLNISSIDTINLERIKIKELDFNDNVYCVRVKNGNFYTMRNGKSFWTGNSAVVSLRQSSHKVIDMWWQGEELYGKVEILDPDCDAARVLRGLLKSNVMLGISSRGVGSVKTIKGEDIVQDDFELIAFDFVSSPSTPGAYLFKENSNEKWGLTPITENHYKKIKWICENGVCRMSDMIKENNFEKEIKNIIPENSTIITQKDCMCTSYKKLFELSDNDFWKKI
jgi:hypothetical protein